MAIYTLEYESRVLAPEETNATATIPGSALKIGNFDNHVAPNVQDCADDDQIHEDVAAARNGVTCTCRVADACFV